MLYKKLYIKILVWYFMVYIYIYIIIIICECGNEPSASIKCGEFLDWPRNG